MLAGRSISSQAVCSKGQHEFIAKLTCEAVALLFSHHAPFGEQVKMGFYLVMSLSVQVQRSILEKVSVHLSCYMITSDKNFLYFGILLSFLKNVLLGIGGKHYVDQSLFPLQIIILPEQTQYKSHSLFVVS